MEKVTQQFGKQAIGWRLARASAGSLLAITAIGHFPGWFPEVTTLVNEIETVVPAHWAPLHGDAIFQWVGVIGVFVTGLITGETRK